MNNKKNSPVTCRKCGLYPSVGKTMLDGLTHEKVSCPKCGLTMYVLPGSSPSAVERWNAVNDRSAPRITRDREQRVLELEELLAPKEHEPYASRPGSRWYDDENYNGWEGEEL